MKVRVVNQPTGQLNGAPWPEPGEELDLPDHVAEAMAAAGSVAKVEKRPASTKNVETRKS